MLDFIGRLMLVTIYLWSGFLNKTINFKHVSAKIGEVGLPFPRACAVGASVLEIVGSFVILFPAVFGPQVFIAAVAALAVYTMVAATLFHPFWAHTGPARQANLVNFLKNIGLTGAFLLLIDMQLKIGGLD